MHKLLGVVSRAMAIAKLTDLHISIPASGSGIGCSGELFSTCSACPVVGVGPLSVVRPSGHCH